MVNLLEYTMPIYDQFSQILSTANYQLPILIHTSVDCGSSPNLFLHACHENNTNK